MSSTYYTCNHRTAPPPPILAKGHIPPSSLPHACYACSSDEIRAKVRNAFAGLDAEICKLEEEEQANNSKTEGRKQAAISHDMRKEKAQLKRIKELEKHKEKVKRDLWKGWKKTWGVKEIPREMVSFETFLETWWEEEEDAEKSFEKK
ncbi:hypothetical protein MMC20_006575 [Loxospora ochrophaea]|nr:hypothetical protein [Loxospora ochrophaea]